MISTSTSFIVPFLDFARVHSRRRKLEKQHTDLHNEREAAKKALRAAIKLVENKTAASEKLVRFFSSFDYPIYPSLHSRVPGKRRGGHPDQARESQKGGEAAPDFDQEFRGGDHEVAGRTGECVEGGLTVDTPVSHSLIISIGQDGERSRRQSRGAETGD